MDLPSRESDAGPDVKPDPKQEQAAVAEPNRHANVRGDGWFIRVGGKPRSI